MVHKGNRNLEGETRAFWTKSDEKLTEKLLGRKLRLKILELKGRQKEILINQRMF